MAIRHIFTHTLDGVKNWPLPGCLDYDANLSAAIDPSVLVCEGRVVHVDPSNGTFVMGAKLNQVPLFLTRSSTDYDVQAGGGDPTDPYNWTSVRPTGKMAGLVATGGFELASTEYDSGDTSWAINDYIHAPTEDQITGSDKSVAGMMYKKKRWPGGNASTVITYGTDNICGQVSRIPEVNQYQRPVLTFWTVYFPGSS
jgi:hypothetical protein